MKRHYTVNIVRMKNRKHIKLVFPAPNVVEIRVPAYMTDKAANKIVQQEDENIQKYLDQVEKDYIALPKFEEGEEFLLLGNYHKLKLVDMEPAMKFENNCFLMKKSLQPYARAVFIDFYKIYARNIIIPRTLEVSEKYNLPVNKIKISSAATRWGSCNGKKNIRFSWRLIVAPPRTIDSIIVHELVHLVHMNHSKDFYGIVEKVVPDYKVHEKWLEENRRKFAWLYD